MALLSELFPTSNYVVAGGGGGGAMEQIYVYNTNIESNLNGGASCSWTVPAGTTWARFELWGGGGGGAGGCCCQQPATSGGAGAYSRKTLSVTPGETYSICAAGTTNCSTPCCGAPGYPTYVSGPNVCMCSLGGPAGCNSCFMIDGGCTCWGGTMSCRGNDYCIENADFGLRAIGGSTVMRPFCGRQSYQMVPQGPYIGGGKKSSYNYCEAGHGLRSVGSHATFPGGGGGGAVSYGGGCCWGHWGAGGLVIITYR